MKNAAPNMCKPRRSKCSNSAAADGADSGRGCLGGILGNQVGGGSGKAAATAIGVVAGAVASTTGSAMARPTASRTYDSRYPQEQAVRRCRMVESYESRTIGYDVSYTYGGRNYTSMMARDPGDRVRLRVSVEPDPRQ
ncbi:hypothetical protein LP419_27925 [Massilia sp. H-1]|nr:hypothetical protein LP419_27925 [Massilia sp. H-1]